MQKSQSLAYNSLSPSGCCSGNREHHLIQKNHYYWCTRYPHPYIARSGDKQSSTGGSGGIGYSGASGAAPSAGQGPEEEKASEERDSVPFPFAVFQFCQYLSSETGASLTIGPEAWGAAFTDKRVTKRARRQRTFMADIDGINDDTVRNLFSIYTEDLITQLHSLSAV